MDPPPLSGSGTGRGLEGIRERMAALDGTATWGLLADGPVAGGCRRPDPPSFPLPDARCWWFRGLRASRTRNNGRLEAGRVRNTRPCDLGGGAVSRDALAGGHRRDEVLATALGGDEYREPGVVRHGQLRRARQLHRLPEPHRRRAPPRGPERRARRAPARTRTSRARSPGKPDRPRDSACRWIGLTSPDTDAYAPAEVLGQPPPGHGRADRRRPGARRAGRLGAAAPG